MLVLAAFLAWQRDLAVLRRAGIVAGLAITLLLVSPWYIAAGVKGGAHYAYELIIFQNFERATKAWDHIHPWWKYGEYILGDFFPWVLWLPPLALHLRRDRNLLFEGIFAAPVRHRGSRYRVGATCPSIRCGGDVGIRDHRHGCVAVHP